MELNWKSAIIRLRDAKRCQAVLAEAMHLADSYILVVACSGNVEVSRDLSIFPLRENEWCLIQPGETYQIKGAERAALIFSFQMYEEKREGHFRESKVWQFPRTRGWMEIQLDLYDLLGRDFYWQQVKLQEVLYRCLETGDVGCVNKVQEVKEWIEQHPYERSYLASLAERSGLHPAYLSEAFKEQVGKTIQRFTTEIKMAEGKRLLQLTSYTMKEVAARLSYDDEFYFSRKFKKETGLSPSQYRLKKQLKIAAYDIDVLGDLIALGHIPYAAPMHPKWTKSYFENYQADIPIHFSAYRANQDWRANLDRVIECKPDVLLAKRDLSQAETDAFAGVLPSMIKMRQDNWKVQLQQVAEAIGATSEARRFLERYEEEAKRCRSLVSEKLFCPPTIMRVAGETMSLYSNDGIKNIFADAGVKWGARCQEVTLAQLTELQPKMLWVLYLRDRKTSLFYEQLQHTNDWHALPAVRKGHVHILSSDTWFEYSASAQWRKLLFLQNQLESM